MTGWLPCTPAWVDQSRLSGTDPLSASSIFMQKDAGCAVALHLSLNDSEVANASRDALLFNQAVWHARLVSNTVRTLFRGNISKTER